MWSFSEILHHDHRAYSATHPQITRIGIACNHPSVMPLLSTVVRRRIDWIPNESDQALNGVYPVTRPGNRLDSYYAPSLHACVRGAVHVLVRIRSGVLWSVIHRVRPTHVQQFDNVHCFAANPVHHHPFLVVDAPSNLFRVHQLVVGRSWHFRSTIKWLAVHAWPCLAYNRHNVVNA